MPAKKGTTTPKRSGGYVVGANWDKEKPKPKGKPAAAAEKPKKAKRKQGAESPPADRDGSDAPQTARSAEHSPAASGRASPEPAAQPPAAPPAPAAAPPAAAAKAPRVESPKSPSPKASPAATPAAAASAPSPVGAASPPSPIVPPAPAGETLGSSSRWADDDDLPCDQEGGALPSSQRLTAEDRAASAAARIKDALQAPSHGAAGRPPSTPPEQHLPAQRPPHPQQQYQQPQYPGQPNGGPADPYTQQQQAERERMLAEIWDIMNYVGQAPPEDPATLDNYQLAQYHCSVVQHYYSMMGWEWGGQPPVDDPSAQDPAAWQEQWQQYNAYMQVPQHGPVPGAGRPVPRGRHVWLRLDPNAGVLEGSLCTEEGPPFGVTARRRSGSNGWAGSWQWSDTNQMQGQFDIVPGGAFAMIIWDGFVGELCADQTGCETVSCNRFFRQDSPEGAGLMQQCAPQQMPPPQQQRQQQPMTPQSGPVDGTPPHQHQGVPTAMHPPPTAGPPLHMQQPPSPMPVLQQQPPQPAPQQHQPAQLQPPQHQHPPQQMHHQMPPGPRPGGPGYPHSNILYPGMYPSPAGMMPGYPVPQPNNRQHPQQRQQQPQHPPVPPQGKQPQRQQPGPCAPAFPSGPGGTPYWPWPAAAEGAGPGGLPTAVPLQGGRMQLQQGIPLGPPHGPAPQKGAQQRPPQLPAVPRMPAGMRPPHHQFHHSHNLHHHHHHQHHQHPAQHPAAPHPHHQHHQHHHQPHHRGPAPRGGGPYAHFGGGSGGKGRAGGGRSPQPGGGGPIERSIFGSMLPDHPAPAVPPPGTAAGAGDAAAAQQQAGAAGA
eukprot:TRINITY_DN37_c0_g1_i1.p1 TRINITY_DN37_c0_g1~~TRINITY_DN37_c0_g1_i1.p1  ORF type:complete len:820 (+),score=155.82 TRINITY_DN37_c0_g1_i1:223-2682(+)